MDNINEEALALWEAMKPSIRSLIQEETKNNLKVVPAIVVSADNDSHTAVVQQLYSQTTMELFNCTGKSLIPGDSVMIWFFNGMTNAWIGVKNDGTAWNT